MQCTKHSDRQKKNKFIHTANEQAVMKSSLLYLSFENEDIVQPIHFVIQMDSH